MEYGDILGRVIRVGDFVAVGVGGRGNKLKRAIVTKLLTVERKSLVESYPNYKYNTLTYPIIEVSTVDLCKYKDIIGHSGGHKKIISNEFPNGRMLECIKLGDANDAFTPDEIQYLKEKKWFKRHNIII